LLQKSSIMAGCALLALAAARADAHERWANGDAAPAWVKRACCAPAKSTISAAIKFGRRRMAGASTGIPIRSRSEQPSPDGEYWIFTEPWTMATRRAAVAPSRRSRELERVSAMPAG